MRLAKVNVDNLPELAAALQVRELPTVMAVHKGKLVESFKGGLPPEKLKEFVARVVALAGGPVVGLRVAGRFRPSLWAQGRDRVRVRMGFGRPCPNTATPILSLSPARTGGPASGQRALEEAAALLKEGKLPEATQIYADLTSLPEHAASATAGLALCALAEEPAWG